MQPLVTGSTWFVDWFGRVTAAIEWRPNDWAALTFGPYVGASTAPDLQIGFVVSAAYIFGVGFRS